LLILLSNCLLIVDCYTQLGEQSGLYIYMHIYALSYPLLLPSVAIRLEPATVVFEILWRP